MSERLLGLAFALEHEAAEIIAKLREADTFRVRDLICHTGQLNGKPVVIGIIGMGAETADRRMEIFLNHFTLDRLILAGYGGALVPELKRNSVWIAENYLSPELAAWAKKIPGAVPALLYSSPVVVGTPETRQVLVKEGYRMVDMETAAVAVHTRKHNVPLLPIRVISDEFGDLLPMAALDASFDLKTQKPAVARLLWHLATHPGDAAPFFRFVGHLSAARKVLTEVVLGAVMEF